MKQRVCLLCVNSNIRFVNNLHIVECIDQLNCYIAHIVFFLCNTFCSRCDENIYFSININSCDKPSVPWLWDFLMYMWIVYSGIALFRVCHNYVVFFVRKENFLNAQCLSSFAVHTVFARLLITIRRWWKKWWG